MDQGREFHSNSHRSRRESPEPEDEKKIEVVVTSKAIVRRKSLAKRLKDMLVGGDTDSVMTFLMGDVIIPQLKDLLTEAVTQGIEQLIHGTGRSPSRRGPSRPQHTNYSSRYSPRSNTPASRGHDRPPAVVRSHRVDEVIVRDRYDAQRVLDQLSQTVDKYGAVTVADLYSSVEWSSTFTDGKWGWGEEDIVQATIRKVREGYLIELPDPEYLD